MKTRDSASDKTVSAYTIAHVNQQRHRIQKTKAHFQSQIYMSITLPVLLLGSTKKRKCSYTPLATSIKQDET